MALEAGLGKKDNARYAAKFQCRFTLKYQFALNRYRTVCRLRAMRIFALEFISENEELSRKRRGAKCPRGDTQSCGELFFQSCIG